MEHVPPGLERHRRRCLVVLPGPDQVACADQLGSRPLRDDDAVHQQSVEHEEPEAGCGVAGGYARPRAAIQTQQRSHRACAYAGDRGGRNRREQVGILVQHPDRAIGSEDAVKEAVRLDHAAGRSIRDDRSECSAAASVRATSEREMCSRRAISRWVRSSPKRSRTAAS